MPTRALARSTESVSSQITDALELIKTFKQYQVKPVVGFNSCKFTPVQIYCTRIRDRLPEDSTRARFVWLRCSTVNG